MIRSSAVLILLLGILATGCLSSPSRGPRDPGGSSDAAVPEVEEGDLADEGDVPDVPDVSGDPGVPDGPDGTVGDAVTPDAGPPECEKDEDCLATSCRLARCVDRHCAWTPLEDQACDADGNPCTADQCVDGACHPGWNTCACGSAAPCPDDGNACNGILECVAGECKVKEGSVVACEPSTTACVDNVCNPATGKCAPVVGKDGVLCNDGDLCTDLDRCDSGKCQGGPAADCDDGDPCTDDSCEPLEGCRHEPNHAACGKGACGAGGWQGPGQCQDGTCHLPAVRACDDGNPCTADFCVASTGCGAEALKDGERCAPARACKAGACEPDPDCWEPPCPAWTRQHDGCHCRALPTGANQCWNGTAFVACSTLPANSPWKGQDAQVFGEPLSFVANADGTTVTDALSGAVWSLETYGPEMYYGNRAENVCSENQPKLPGLGWRLPAMRELLGLLDYGRPTCPLGSPVLRWPTVTACDPQPHGDSLEFWSSDGDSDHGIQYGMSLTGFGTGVTDVLSGALTTDEAWIRCLQTPSPYVGGRFVTRPDGTVLDRITGTQWQVKSDPEAVNGSWALALQHCAAKGGGWRLPTVKEWAAVWDFDITGCGLPKPFEVCSADGMTFWTSTTRNAPPAGIVATYIGDGYLSLYMTNAEGDLGNALCVRTVP